MSRVAGSGEALVADARAGRRLHYEAGPPPKALVERMLAVPTELMLDARERNPGLAALDLPAALERAEHHWLDHLGLEIHLERHQVDDAAPTVIVAPGLGDHSRRQLALAAALAERGFNSWLVDRQGHGLSAGRRGDAPLEADLGLLERVIGLVRERSSAPLVLLGDSLGGVMSWYLLTREPDIDAAVCHCIGHPEVYHDPRFRRKAPLLRALARIAPYAPIGVRQIADYDQVALDPVTKRYFDDQVDALFNFSVSARSVASYVGFRPGIAWERVETPALVIIGAADGMVTPHYTRRCFECAHPPRAELVEIAGAGHQLFLDHIALAIDPLVDWIDTTLEASRPTIGYNR